MISGSSGAMQAVKTSWTKWAAETTSTGPGRNRSSVSGFDVATRSGIARRGPPETRRAPILAVRDERGRVL